jgi:hypothetical protein
LSGKVRLFQVVFLMLTEFLMPDSKHGLYIQYRVMEWNSAKRRHFPLSQFWSDRELMKIDPSKVYFFSPAFRQFGKNIVLGSYVVWADFDHVSPGDVDFRGFPPSLQVFSGGGIHAYWRFDDFVSVDELAVALDLVVSRFSSDLLARDVTRFMRVPGSMNPKYDPPVECRVIDRGPDYSYSDFVRRLMLLSPAHAGTPSPLTPQSRASTFSSGSVTLYRRGSLDGGFWFWQASQPYRIGQGEFIAREFSFDTQVEVLSLGGGICLYSGDLGHVPDDLRGYLTEVRIL